MDLIRLQRVQNRTARLVTRTKTQDHITPVLRDLHWLPVSSRIDFQLCLYMYKALKKTVPIYISDELNLYEPKRPSRSSYAGPLYTASVGRKEVSQTLILQSRGLGYGIAYRWIYAKLHPL